MIVVEAMPGELGLAHAGRIAYLNGMTGIGELRRETLGKASNHLKRNEFRQQFKVLAASLKVDPETYLAEHSLLPFWHAYPRGKKESHDYQTLVAKWLKPADGPVLDGLRFCVSCAQEDERRPCSGICWWRREHQLPGVDICIHHTQSLFNVTDHAAAERLPSHYLLRGNYADEASPDSNDPVIVKYRMFATLLLNNPKRFAPVELRDRVRQRCIELAIMRCFRDRAPRSSLSLHVRSNFPPHWLRKHYPALLRAEYEGRDLNIDAAFFGQGASGTVLAMILASLFENVEDLESGPERSEVEHHASPEKTPMNPTKSASDFTRVFVNARGDSKQVAKLLGCAYRTAFHLRRKFGLPVMPRVLTTMHHRAFEKMLGASDRDLAIWGEAMKVYWKAHPQRRGHAGEDLAEFLRITAQ